MKKLSAVFFVITGCLAFLFQASAVPGSGDIQPQKHVQFANFWSAMFSGDFYFPEENPVTDEQRKFSYAMKDVVERNYNNAENILKELSRYARDNDIRFYSARLTNDLFIAQDKWSQLEDFVSQDRNYKGGSVYSSFINQPPESYNFGRPSDTLPLVMVSGLPFIKVRIGGRELNFLFDTGAEFTILADDAAASLGIKPINYHSDKLLGAAGNRTGMSTALIEKLSIGNLNINYNPAFIVDKNTIQFQPVLTALGRVDGIIGWRVIRNLDVDIDYKNQRLILRKPAQRDAGESNLYWLEMPIVKVTNESGAELNFFLDTGANVSSFTDYLLMKMPNLNTESGYSSKIGMGGAAYSSDKIISMLQIKVKNSVLTFPKMRTSGYAADRIIKVDGVLGSNIALNGKVRIDYTNRVFEIVL